MLSKIKNILTYYDSEPTEITQGIIWLIFFPVVYSAEHGLNLWLVIISMIIGFTTIYSVCYHPLKTRKTLSLGVFLFSLVVVVMYYIKGNYVCPTHWGWIVISLSAFFNLKRICNHYYRSENG
tara:strand:+ start:867 stop:1235 length:369 start_codon:yes stop_codon:yes gene_type:complete